MTRFRVERNGEPTAVRSGAYRTACSLDSPWSSACSLFSGPAPGSQHRKRKEVEKYKKGRWEKGERKKRMWRIREELGRGGKRKSGEWQDSRRRMWGRSWNKIGVPICRLYIWPLGSKKDEHSAMKKYGEVEVEFNAYVTSALDGDKRSASLRWEKARTLCGDPEPVCTRRRSLPVTVQSPHWLHCSAILDRWCINLEMSPRTPTSSELDYTCVGLIAFRWLCNKENQVWRVPYFCMRPTKVCR